MGCEPPSADPKSDYFVEDPDERRGELEALLEDRDEYTAENVFWVPERGPVVAHPGRGQAAHHRQDHRRRDGRHREGEPAAQGCAAEDLRPARTSTSTNLGKLIDLVSRHRPRHQGAPGQGHPRSGLRVLPVPLRLAEGKGGGEFYTPTSVVRLLVEMLEPYKGRVYDPCCGSGGMFVQSLKFIEAHDGQPRSDLRLRSGIQPHHLADWPG